MVNANVEPHLPTVQDLKWNSGEMLHHFFTNTRAVPLVCCRVGREEDFAQTPIWFIMMLPRCWMSLSLFCKYRSSDVENIIQVQGRVAGIMTSA